MSNPWWVEFWRLLGIALVVLVAGPATGFTVEIAWIATTGYLGWHAYCLLLLQRWLSGAASSSPPQATGIWGEVFALLRQSRKRSRQQKRKLVAMLSRFQESTEALPDATVVLSASDEVDWFNAAATRLLDLHAPQDVGKPISYIVRNPAFVDYLAREEWASPLEFTPRGEDRRVLAVRIVPFGDQQRLLLAQDVTPLHALERVRQDFVANASHELRTPLTVLNGYVENLLDEDRLDAERLRPVLRTMHHQTQRMQRVIEDLLLLSRLEASPPPEAGASVAVAALLTAIREDAMALATSDRVEIVLETDTELALRGEETELRSAFSNLIVNAVQHAGHGGEIRVEWHADARGAHLAVIDHGQGIPPEHVARITERFYRIDVGRSRRSGGTGLGLAIVKHVLERHDGRLEIESSLGSGSRFTCYFPSTRVVSLRQQHATAQG